jgi:hypothetical protein
MHAHIDSSHTRRENKKTKLPSRKKGGKFWESKKRTDIEKNLALLHNNNNDNNKKEFTTSLNSPRFSPDRKNFPRDRFSSV